MIHFRLILGLVLSLLLILWLAAYLWRRQSGLSKALSGVVLLMALVCIWQFIAQYGELCARMQARLDAISQGGTVLPYIVDAAGLLLTVVLVVLIFRNLKNRK